MERQRAASSGRLAAVSHQLSAVSDCVKIGVSFWRWSAAVREPAPQARNILAQHTAEPGSPICAAFARIGGDDEVLGKAESYTSPVGTAEVLTQTLSPFSHQPKYTRLRCGLRLRSSAGIYLDHVLNTVSQEVLTKLRSAVPRSRLPVRVLRHLCCAAVEGSARVTRAPLTTDN